MKIFTEKLDNKEVLVIVDEERQEILEVISDVTKNIYTFDQYKSRVIYYIKKYCTSVNFLKNSYLKFSISEKIIEEKLLDKNVYKLLSNEIYINDVSLEFYIMLYKYNKNYLIGEEYLTLTKNKLIYSVVDVKIKKREYLSYVLEIKNEKIVNLIINSLNRMKENYKALIDINAVNSIEKQCFSYNNLIIDNIIRKIKQTNKTNQ